MIVCSDDKLTTFPLNQCPQMLMSSCTNLSINSTTGINHQAPSHPHEALKCPRCDSSNTKFCYYNNYSLSQPRHFCKSCKRYWTRGGSLRNVPVGGSSRKNKRLKRRPPPPIPPPPPPPPPSIPLPNHSIFTHEYHHLISDHDHLTNFGHSFGLDHCIEDYNQPLPPLDYQEAADNPWHFIPFDNNNTNSVVLRSATPSTVYWNL